MTVRDNPVRTTLPISVALALFLNETISWLLNVVNADPEWEASLMALAWAVIVLASERVGQWVQRYLTEPKGVLDEIIAAMADDPSVHTSRYAQGRVLEGIGVDPFEVVPVSSDLAVDEVQPPPSDEGGH